MHPYIHARTHTSYSKYVHGREHRFGHKLYAYNNMYVYVLPTFTYILLYAYSLGAVCVGSCMRTTICMRMYQ